MDTLRSTESGTDLAEKVIKKLLSYNESPSHEYAVEFLPVLPHPVTKHETVYTCLVNLSSIAATLKQDVLPFTCDEGVYHIVIDIYLHKPEMFSKLFTMLCGFHMAKAAFRCAGKFLRGSGIADGFSSRRSICGTRYIEG